MALPIGQEKEGLRKARERVMVEVEMTTVKAALKNYLGREPDNEDAKLCSQILSAPWDGTYRLLYAGKELGTIKYVIGPEVYRVEFHPLQKMN